jgi:hypothetical protein
VENKRLRVPIGKAGSANNRKKRSHQFLARKIHRARLASRVLLKHNSNPSKRLNLELLQPSRSSSKRGRWELLVELSGNKLSLQWERSHNRQLDCLVSHKERAFSVHLLHRLDLVGKVQDYLVQQLSSHSNNRQTLEDSLLALKLSQLQAYLAEPSSSRRQDFLARLHKHSLPKLQPGFFLNRSLPEQAYLRKSREPQ